MKLRFALGIIYRAKSWTVCSVADAKWSATRNSPVASCYQPSSCLVDDNFHLGSVSSAVKCHGKGSCRCRHQCNITNGTDPLTDPLDDRAAVQNRINKGFCNQSAS